MSKPPHNKTKKNIERRVLGVRKDLKENSDLGEYGARAIQREFTRQNQPSPSLRTMGYILERHGAVDAKRRVRRPAPPTGWYLPEVAAGRAEIDSVDIVEDLKIKDGPLVDVLTIQSILGKLPGAWPVTVQITTDFTLRKLIQHWRRFGLPDYAQFDNDTRFQGSHRGQFGVGRIVRLCLQLNVVPVFVPPCERGFQAAIENFNGRWEEKVWSRFHHKDLRALRKRSTAYINALRERHTLTISSAPSRQPVPEGFEYTAPRPLSGRIVFLRRSNEKGHVNILNCLYDVDRQWPSRLVRCDIDLHAQRVRFVALRRAIPSEQRILLEADFRYAKGK